MSQNSYEESYLGRLRKLIGKEKAIIPAARAVVFNRKGRLLLIRRRDNGRWAMPAGAMELDESIFDCLVREVREETGLEVQAATLFAVWTDPSKTSIITHFGDPYQLIVFVFHVDDWRGELVTQTDETIDAGFFSLDRLPEILPHYHDTLRDWANYKSNRKLVLK